MKNLLLYSVFLLTSISVLAQLYVKPNGSTDSYVYVNDEVLFVEQDVNLVVNTNDPTTKASIYLRNQAQLVQGTTSSANTGTGLISVIQNTPDDDSWDYSFWGSPVGNPSGIGNQNFGILKINDSLSKTNSTVTLTTAGYNGSSDPLTISRRWLYRYPAGGPWTSIYTGDNVPAGYGFIMKGVDVTNHNQKYDFRGRPNNGTMDVEVQANKSTLSGNPYPSALDLNLVFNDPENIEIGAFRYWDEDRTIPSHFYIDNKGGYGSWIPGPSPYVDGGVYTVPTFWNYDSGGNPGSGSGDFGQSFERLYAPIGQGFMIYGASTGSINIKNSHRVYVVEDSLNNSQYRGPIGGRSNGISVTDPSIEEQVPLLRIYTNFVESHYRDMVLMFHENSTDGYDRGLDAKHPMDGAGADAYFPVAVGSDTNFLPFVIQTVPLDLGKRIPIAFNLDQQYEFSVKAVEEVNIQHDAYLWDSEDNGYQQINGGDEAVLTLPAGEYDNRFFIVFRGEREVIENSEGTLAEEAIKASVDFFQNNPVKQLEVSNPDKYDIISAQIFDMSGKLVLQESNIGTQSKFNFSTATLNDGVYLVKLTTVENVEIDYKMVIYN